MEMFFVFVLIVAAFIGLALFNTFIENKRRDSIAELAQRLGLSFSQYNGDTILYDFGFLDGLSQGENRHASNIMSGIYQGYQVTTFHYHYETVNHTSKGRSTTHHYLSILALSLLGSFPKTQIAPEGFLSKIAQAMGYEDIDFESQEFSNSFCVRSKDKKFAYDICNARMIEYLLGSKNLRIQIERDVLALSFNGRIEAEGFESNLERLIRVRSFFPEYLFSKEAV